MGGLGEADWFLGGVWGLLWDGDDALAGAGGPAWKGDVDGFGFDGFDGFDDDG